MFIQPTILPPNLSNVGYSFCVVGLIVVPSFENLGDKDVFSDILGNGFDQDGGIAIVDQKIEFQLKYGNLP